MRPRTRYVSAIHDSGGQRALLVDLAEACEVEFAKISSDTQARLGELLDPGLEPINPLDAWGTGNAADDIYTDCLLALDADPETGLSLFACDLCPIEDPESFYPAIAEAVRGRLRNPLAWLVHLSAAGSEHQMAKLRALGIPVLMGTETGLRATRHVLEYSQFQRDRAAGGRGVVAHAVSQPDNLAELRQEVREAGSALDEHASKQLLAAYGLTITRERRCDGLDAAVRAANEIGFPVALKTAGGDLHKTEHGGVRLDLANADQLAAAYRDFEARLGPQVLVQEMIEEGAELILGIVNDPQFGPMLTLGTGGIFVEVLEDVRMLALPTTSDAVRQALLGLRGVALLQGARGRSPADLEAVTLAAMGLAALASDLGDLIAEVDVNPLRALPNRAVVVDALVVPKPSA
jgi:acyl-CoA synthetase (NDP forming)